MTSWYTLAFEYHVAVDPPANRHGGARMHDKLPVLLGRAILRLLGQTGMSPANISKRFYKQRIQFFFGSIVGTAKTGAKCQRPRCSQSESYSDHLSSSLPIFSSTIIHPILSKCYDAPAWAQAVNERERLFAGLISLPALPALLLLAMSPQWFSGGLLVSRALNGVFFLVLQTSGREQMCFGQPYSDISKRLDAWAKFQIKSGMDDMV